jgi:hypothetical protein
MPTLGSDLFVPGNRPERFAKALASGAARGVNAQVFTARDNEIFFMNHPRPLRPVHRAEDRTPESVAAHSMPALKASFIPMNRSGDVFTWHPV